MMIIDYILNIMKNCYYKDFKEEEIQKRVQIYLTNLTYFCVDFMTFYDSNSEEVKFYIDKMSKYIDKKEK